jgi:hypothetical protein
VYCWRCDVHMKFNKSVKLAFQGGAVILTMSDLSINFVSYLWGQCVAHDYSTVLRYIVYHFRVCMALWPPNVFNLFLVYWTTLTLVCIA